MSEPDMDTARRWLELVRSDGDSESKAKYLREKGYTDEQVEELMAEEEPECEDC